jgi:hypothetical protein
VTQLSKILGQSAVSLSDAIETGKASGFIVHDGRIVMVELDSKTLLPAASIRTFEGEALTHGPATLTEVQKDGPLRASPVLGMSAVTEEGELLGTIDDAIVDGEGRIVQLQLRDASPVDGARVSVIGGFAAIVR